MEIFKLGVDLFWHLHFLKLFGVLNLYGLVYLCSFNLLYNYIVRLIAISARFSANYLTYRLLLHKGFLLPIRLAALQPLVDFFTQVNVLSRRYQDLINFVLWCLALNVIPEHQHVRDLLVSLRLKNLGNCHNLLFLLKFL